jgi:hypothetical protein
MKRTLIISTAAGIVGAFIGYYTTVAVLYMTAPEVTRSVTSDNATLYVTIDQNGVVQPINGLRLHSTVTVNEPRTIQQLIQQGYNGVTSNELPEWVKY